MNHNLSHKELFPTVKVTEEDWQPILRGLLARVPFSHLGYLAAQTDAPVIYPTVGRYALTSQLRLKDEKGPKRLP